MHKLTIIGRIGGCQVKSVAGQQLVSFSVAVNDGYYDKQNQWVERTAWYTCNIWRKEGQSVEFSNRITKGSIVYVEGSPSVKIYQDKNDKAVADVIINVSDWKIVQKKDTTPTTATDSTPARTSGVASSAAPTTPTTPDDGSETDKIDDDLPF